MNTPIPTTSDVVSPQSLPSIEVAVPIAETTPQVFDHVTGHLKSQPQTQTQPQPRYQGVACPAANIYIEEQHIVRWEMTGEAWCFVVILIVVCWPLCWLPCVMDSCKRPVYTEATRVDVATRI